MNTDCLFEEEDDDENNWGIETDKTTGQVRRFRQFAP